jgi:membrane-associated phospholipid phosphatase
VPQDDEGQGKLKGAGVHEHHPGLAPIPLKNRRVWRDLARILSTIFNPFLTALALFIILSHIQAHTTEQFWSLLFLSTFFTSIAPMLFIFWLYATDRISDLDMSVREEREKVFGVFVVFYLLGTIVLWLTHSPRLLIATMAGYSMATIVVQYITRYWKISTHALGITAPLVVLCLLYGRQPLPFLVLIPMVCWARVYLKAHTVGQVVAGAALATASVALFFWLFHVRTLAW